MCIRDSDEADLREDDVVVEHIHEDAKTEEKAVSYTHLNRRTSPPRIYTGIHP